MTIYHLCILRLAYALLGVKTSRSPTVDQALHDAFDGPIDFLKGKIGDKAIRFRSDRCPDKPSVTISIEELMIGASFSPIWTVLDSDFLPLQRRSTRWNMEFSTLSAISDGCVSRTSCKRSKRKCACITPIVARVKIEEVGLGFAYVLSYNMPSERTWACIGIMSCYAMDSKRLADTGL